MDTSSEDSRSGSDTYLANPSKQKKKDEWDTSSEENSSFSESDHENESHEEEQSTMADRNSSPEEYQAAKDKLYNSEHALKAVKSMMNQPQRGNNPAIKPECKLNYVGTK